jgi:hypothetical protein
MSEDDLLLIIVLSIFIAVLVTLFFILSQSPRGDL